MSRQLALFDLDNTLLAGDSDHAWGEFLIAKKLVDEPSHRAENDRFYRQYLAGELDIHGYVKFTLEPVLAFSAGELAQLHEEFMASAVEPMILDEARALVDHHQGAGDCCVIITATNELVTAPIAKAFGVEHLIATELEVCDKLYTGEIAGTPCYQAGKVSKLQQWLAQRGETLTIADAVCYSDSFNDLPLLRSVKRPVAVDPDSKLRKYAIENAWEIISLRG